MSEAPAVVYPLQEPKAWGSVSHVFVSPYAMVSCLNVRAGGYSSIHYHELRANRFYVDSGAVAVEVFDGFTLESLRVYDTHILRAGDVFDVPSMRVHRFIAVESGQLVEVYWPDRPGGIVMHSDIQRLEVGGFSEEQPCTA